MGLEPQLKTHRGKTDTEKDHQFLGEASPRCSLLLVTPKVAASTAVFLVEDCLVPFLSYGTGTEDTTLWDLLSVFYV